MWLDVISMEMKVQDIYILKIIKIQEDGKYETDI